MSRRKELSFSYLEIDDISVLDPDDRQLLEEARATADNAYAPYSRFSVGAALRLESGRIVKGTNIENAAFPSGLCAERSAIACAVTSFPGDKIITLAVAAKTDEGLTEDIVSPCGNCRQVIAEEEIRNQCDIKLILSSRSKIYIVSKCSDLLPLQFSSRNLRSGLR
jgi:cytidine deaminase